MQGNNEFVVICPDELKKYGWETLDGVVYVLELDDRRHIDVFHVGNTWSFQLTEEPALPKEDVAIFTGRNVFYMYELLDLYYGITGVRLM